MDVELDEQREDVAGVPDDVALAPGSGPGDEVVVKGEDQELVRRGELPVDPRLPFPGGLAFVESGLGGVESHDPHRLHASGLEHVEAHRRVALLRGITTVGKLSITGSRKPRAMRNSLA